MIGGVIQHDEIWNCTTCFACQEICPVSIEPMTKLEMDLQLTVPSSSGADEPDLASVVCEGIVVRVTPEVPTEDGGPYEIAVFFTHIEPESLAALENHIAMVIA